MSDLCHRRAERARRGSRRRRDQEALVDERTEAPRLDQAERHRRLMAETTETAAASEAWAKARDGVAASVRHSTFSLWIEPLRLAGECKGALHLISTANRAGWVERRYGALLGEAVRGLTSYRGVFISSDPEGSERSREGLR